MSRLMTNPTNDLCTQRRLRSAWASIQSDQKLRCPHVKDCVLSYPMSAKRILWSDWADAQPGLSPYWTHSHFVGFVMRRLMSFFLFAATACVEQHQTDVTWDCPHPYHVLLSHCCLLIGRFKDVPAEVREAFIGLFSRIVFIIILLLLFSFLLLFSLLLLSLSFVIVVVVVNVGVVDDDDDDDDLIAEIVVVVFIHFVSFLSQLEVIWN